MEMSTGVEYYCPCLSLNPHPPPTTLESSKFSFHPLHSLYFCEECDAIRCNRCVLLEVSGYYCPNCLFEVPSASVRAERNRCARNCFLCPNCDNTLTIVASDPPEDGEGSQIISSTVIGEPPFYFYCHHCRWDSTEIDMLFEKPTGLASYFMQKFEDAGPEVFEFEHLREHYEPWLKQNSSNLPSTIGQYHYNPITARAAYALSRNIHGMPRLPLLRNRSVRYLREQEKTEIPDYNARVEAGSGNGLVTGTGGEADVEFLKHLENINEVVPLEQRWTNSWPTSLRLKDMRPERVPLHSKKSKRCPSCRHILIKPEQKAQSVRFKIKLVAANYLPAITVILPHIRAAAELIKRASTQPKSAQAAAAAIVEEHGDAASGAMIAGKTYPFHLSLTNPLYDPIQVRLHVQRSVAATSGEGKQRAPFAVSLPSGAFPVGAFAEAWEYEDDEDLLGDEEDYDGARGNKDRDGRARQRNIGVLERRANVTVVGGEVVLGKDAQGAVKFNMLVTYTYRADDPVPENEDPVATPSKRPEKDKQPQMKTFSFYTVVELGHIIRREESRMDTDTDT